MYISRKSKQEILRYFKHTVHMAAHCRLTEDIDRTKHLDELVERYYKEYASVYTEDMLVEIEETQRTRTASEYASRNLLQQSASEVTSL